jgi:hypothetical protein
MDCTELKNILLPKKYYKNSEYPFSDGEGKLSKKEEKPVGRDPKKTERRILIFFSIWFAFGILISLIVLLAEGIGGLLNVLSTLIAMTLSAFTITGILSFIYYRKSAIISTKWLFIRALKISLIIGLLFAVGMYILLTQTTILDSEPVKAGSGTLILMFLGLFLGGFIAAFTTFLVFLFYGFGIIFVLSVLIKSKTPDMLVEITKITSRTTELDKKKDKRKYMGFVWLGWAFGIPDVLDTSTLSIKEGNFHEEFSKKSFRKAVLWQFFFGLVLVIYISFSPFLLDYVNMQQLFSISSISTTFIPLLILPWFIYLKLEARIKGPVRDFRLFDGLSSRMFQTLIAFGTILLLVRMALRNPEFVQVMFSFIIFFIFFIPGIFVGTFVYFNYFENDLASDIANKYKKLKEEEPTNTKT